MFQFLYNVQCSRNGIMRLITFNIDDCTDTTVIMFKTRIIKSSFFMIDHLHCLCNFRLRIVSRFFLSHVIPPIQQKRSPATETTRKLFPLQEKPMNSLIAEPLCSSTCRYYTVFFSKKQYYFVNLYVLFVF